jgi:Ca-activated chloride channel family protein
MRSKAAVILAILNCFLLAAVASGQDKPGSDDVVRVDTQLVDVPITVTDKTGKPIAGLKIGNFEVYEDGRKQELAEFAATNAPFEVALLLDTSGSTRSDLQLIQRAAQQFIASLRPGDRVSLIAYTTKRDDVQAYAAAEILSGLTDDRAKLKTAADKISTSNGTPYYDSLIDIAEKVFHDRPSDEFRGRRALVALTDGVDSTSAADFAEAKERLEAAGVSSYFIQVDTRTFFEDNLLGDCQNAIRFSQAQIRRYYRSFKGAGNMERAASFCQLGDFERLAVSKKLYEIADAEMNDLAKTSGGRVFPVADLGEARTAFRSVADEIGTRYSLGYYSSNEKRDGTYRKITVQLKGIPPGAKLRAREGYTAPAN